MNLEDLVRQIRREDGQDARLHSRQDQPSIDEIMRRVNVEVVRRRDSISTSAISTKAQDSDALNQQWHRMPRWESSVARLPYQKEYRLADLLSFSDADFIDQCYRILLRRLPDADGLEYFLGSLRRGELSKVEVLGTLRFSGEGMKHQVHVDGLLIPYTMRRWMRKPVVGPILCWLRGLARLGESGSRHELLDAAQARESQHIGRIINSSADFIENQFQSVEAKLSEFARVETVRKLIDTIDESNGRLSTIDASIARIETLIAKLEQVDNQKAERAELESVVTDLSLMKSQVIDDRDRQKALHDGLQGVTTDLDSVKSQIIDDHNHQKNVRGELEGVAADLTVVKSQAVSDRENQKALRGEFEAVATELAATKLQVTENYDMKKALRNELEGAFADLTGVKSQLMKESARLTSIESEISACASRKEMADYAAQLQTVQNVIVQVREASAAFVDRASVSNIEGSVASTQTRLTQVEHEVLGLTTVTQRLNENLQTVEQRNQEKIDQDPLVFDSLYVDFEERFRGGRDLIQARIEPYLQWIRDANAGSDSTPVLDVGCGRGEWLELLRDNQMVGRGIDLNRVFVGMCLERGLSVEFGDAISIMRELPDASFGAVTSMHLVEHLPLEQMIAMIDEAKRLLCPGGIIILETPNPENVSVGSCSFYMDPTHKNPIPPELLRWMVEARGFEAVRIERLTQHREISWPGRVADDVPGAATINAMSDAFVAAPDYAIVASRS